MQDAMFSTGKDNWETPQTLFDELNEEFNFDCDACATPENKKCKNYMEDALKDYEWACHKSIFMNPPYGRAIGKFIEKAYYQSRIGNRTVVCLLPARTDTKWFHEYCVKGEIRFLKGRLKFGNATNNAPFPSMVVIFKSKETK